jgi:oligosaccharide repeat unit polymerase
LEDAREAGAARTETKILPLRIHWWMNPIWPTLLMMTPLVLYGLNTGSDQYSVWRVQKYFDVDIAIIISFGVIALVTGVMVVVAVGSRGRVSNFSISSDVAVTLDRLSRVGFGLVVFSYICWIALAIRGGLSLQHVIGVVDLERGAVSRLKDVSSPVGGLTTFTQLGSVVVVLEVLLLRVGLRRHRKLIVVVVFLATMRALFYGERLSLIEVVLPLTIICILIPKNGGRPWSDRLGRFAPVMAVPALWIVFAIFEYSRSWLSYRNKFDGSYPEFVTQRLVGYYVTALNNSALFVEKMPLYGKSIFYTFSGVWDAPGASLVIGVPRIGEVSNRTWWRYTLTSEGNPEFNNPGSFGVTFAELGWIGNFAFWLPLGIILGLIFNSLRRGQIAGIVALPCVYVGLIELPRIIYWTQGRFVPTAGLLLLTAYLVNRRRKEVPSSQRIRRHTAAAYGPRAQQAVLAQKT